MPATSRSGERLSRRSGSERAGSPSKSRIAQPRSGVSIVWPRCRSPWVRMTLPPAPMCESSCSRSRTSCPRPEDRLERRRLGQLDEHAARSARRRSRSGSTATPCSARRARTPGRRPPSRAPCAARPSPRRARARARAAPSGSRASSSSASSQPSRAPARYSCRIPSVASTQPALEVVPAGQRRDVREAARGQEAQQLELRVLARLHAPERLQDQRVAEHDRRVGLLDADRPHVDRAAEAPSDGRRRPVEARARPRRRVHLGVRAHAVQQLAPERGVGEPVVDRPAVGARRSRARPSPRRPAAARAAPGRSRASPPRSTASISAAPAAAAPSRSGTASTHVEVRRPRATWSANQRCATTQSCSASCVSAGEVAGAVAAHRSSLVLDELEPVEAARRQRQQVRPARRSSGSASGRRSRPGSGPCTRDRSSSTACALRARLCTHSITSSS